MIIYSLQLMLIWVLNITRHAFSITHHSPVLFVYIPLETSKNILVWLKVPWSFPSESAIRLFFFNNSSSVFYKLSQTKLGQFSESSFGEICIQRLTACSNTGLVRKEGHSIITLS